MFQRVGERVGVFMLKFVRECLSVCVRARVGVRVCMNEREKEAETMTYFRNQLFECPTFFKHFAANFIHKEFLLKKITDVDADADAKQLTLLLKKIETKTAAS